MRTPTPEIRRALDGRLMAALPGLGLDPAQDAAWPNAAFTPHAERPYVRPNCLFGNTSPAGLGPQGFELLSGVYQVDVLGLSGRGVAQAEELARGLADAFRGGARLVCGEAELRISASSVGPAMHTEGRLRIPVSVRWTCHAAR